MRDPSPPPAATIGNYVIDGLLGRGGMGTVYRAHHQGSPVAVALKVITGGSGSPDTAARFRREVEIAKALEHPNIVRVLDHGLDAGDGSPGSERFWCVQELVDGQGLDTATLAADWGWRAVCELLRDVADALAHAHAAGVIHRDVKPANILLDAAGTPHLTDFGLAKSVLTGQATSGMTGQAIGGLSRSNKVTRTGEALGTPHYMSPEQARGEIRDLGPTTDVWALGCVGYELLTGRLAFAGDTPAAVIGNVITRRPTPLPRVAPDLPTDVARVIQGCLAHDPARRYPSGAELRDDLDRLLAGTRVLGTPDGGQLWLTGLVSVGVAGLAMLIGWAAWPTTTNPARTAIPTVVERRAADSLAQAAWDLRTADAGAAADRLREILASAPHLHDWRVRYGQLCWWIGREADAVTAWQAVAHTTEAGHRARLHLGLASVMRFDWITAAHHLQGPPPLGNDEGALWTASQAIIDDRWDDARAALAGRSGWAPALLRSYIETATDGDAVAAERDADTALAAGVPVLWAYTCRSRARTALGNLDGALADAEAAVRLSGGAAAQRYNRSVVLRALGDLDAELADLNAALQSEPDFVVALSARGRARRERGDLAAASTDHEHMVQLAPNDPLAWVSCGTTRSAQGDGPGALQAYDQAIRLAPELTIARRNRGSERVATGDFAGALEDFEVVCRLAPDEAESWYGRGNARHRLGQLAGAGADYDRALALDPNHANARYNRAVWHMQRRDHARAIADLDHLLQIQPDAHDARALRARLTGD